MKDLRKMVILGLSLVPLMVDINPAHASGQMPKIMMSTDNGSALVEVSFHKGTMANDMFTIDAPQEVKFDIVIMYPGAFDPINHVNYEYQIVDESGNMLAHKTGLHLQDGMDTQSVTFSKTGSFTLTIDIEGTGITKPYDKSQSGTASVMVTVVPEFPLSVMTIMAAVVGLAIATTKFKNRL